MYPASPLPLLNLPKIHQSLGRRDLKTTYISPLLCGEGHGLDEVAFGKKRSPLYKLFDGQLGWMNCLDNQNLKFALHHSRMSSTAVGTYARGRLGGTSITTFRSEQEPSRAGAAGAGNHQARREYIVQPHQPTYTDRGTCLPRQPPLHLPIALTGAQTECLAPQP